MSVSKEKEAGEDLDMVRDVLGHDSIKTTIDTYGHIFKGRKRWAATMIDLLFEENWPGEPDDPNGYAQQTA